MRRIQSVRSAPGFGTQLKGMVKETIDETLHNIKLSFYVEDGAFIGILVEQEGMPDKIVFPNIVKEVTLKAKAPKK